MYTPVNPSFTIYKCGLRGSKLYRHVFVMKSKSEQSVVARETWKYWDHLYTVSFLLFRKCCSSGYSIIHLFSCTFGLCDFMVLTNNCPNQTHMRRPYPSVHYLVAALYNYITTPVAIPSTYYMFRLIWFHFNIPTLDTTLNITKSCLYNFDPLKSHFYIVKVGFTGVYIIFFISAQKHRLWVLVRTASSRRF